MMNITQDELKKIVKYNSETGDMYWLPRDISYFSCEKMMKAFNTQFANKKISSINNTGYLRLIINGKRELAHRVAWLYFYGEEPNGIIDHINGVRTDNRISNLRMVSCKENGQNRINYGRGKYSRFMGVSKNKKTNKFVATIGVGYKTKHIGTFETEEEARIAYLAEKKSLHNGYRDYKNFTCAEKEYLDSMAYKNKYLTKNNNCTGVTKIKETGKWRVVVNKNCIRHHIGVYDNLLDAVAARFAADREF